MGTQKHRDRERISSTTYTPFIVFEGNSGVGKTTLSRTVAALRSTTAIGEYFHFLDEEATTLPAYPPTDIESVRKSQQLWPSIDVTRAMHIRATEAPAIVDTSPLSVFAYELAIARLGMPYAMIDLAKDYLDLFARQVIHQPSAWIFLYAQSAVILERLERKGGTRPLLERADTIDYLDKFRHHFCRRYLKSSEYLVVPDTSNPNTIQDILDFVSDCPRTETTGLVDFLNDLTTDVLPVKDLLQI